MAIDLMKIQPHKVSRDLSGYITYLYGPGKIGKTTFGSQMPKPLLLAFEKGYNAIPNIQAADVSTWSEMKQVLRQLKRPEVKQRYQSIIVDTVDIILTGRKSDLYLAKQLGDHEVLLDLTDYSASNEPYKVKLTYNQTIDSLSYKIDPSTVTVTIKNKVSSLSNVSYDLLNENKLNSKLSVGEVKLSKSEVVVKGAQDALDKIATVKALVDLNNETLNDAGTYDIDNVPLVAYDVNGKQMTNIDIVPSTVTATITLNTYSASVPISVRTKGTLVTGKSISSISKCFNLRLRRLRSTSF